MLKRIIFSEAQKAKITRLYLSGKTMDEIGKKYGCSIFYIQKTLISLGIQRRLQGTRFGKLSREIVKQKYLAGATTTEIGNWHKVSRQAVAQMLARMDVPRRRKGRRIKLDMDLELD